MLGWSYPLVLRLIQEPTHKSGLVAGVTRRTYLGTGAGNAAQLYLFHSTDKLV
jgi:hypothetical protein